MKIDKNSSLKKHRRILLLSFTFSLSVGILGFYFELNTVLKVIQYAFLNIGILGFLLELFRKEKGSIKLIPFEEIVYFKTYDSNWINQNLQMGSIFFIGGQIIRFNFTHQLIISGIILTIIGLIALVITFSFIATSVYLKEIESKPLLIFIKAICVCSVITIIGFFSILHRMPFDSLCLFGVIGIAFFYLMTKIVLFRFQVKNKKQFLNYLVSFIQESSILVLLFLNVAKSLVYNPFKEVFPFYVGYIYNPIVDMKCIYLLVVFQVCLLTKMLFLVSSKNDLKTF